MPACLEFGAQLKVIKDLTVKNDPERLILVSDGLLPTAQINDAETRFAQRRGTTEINAELVRSAVPDHAQHLADHALRNRIGIFETKNSDDATHGIEVLTKMKALSRRNRGAPRVRRILQEPAWRAGIRRLDACLQYRGTRIPPARDRDRLQVQSARQCSLGSSRTAPCPFCYREEKNRTPPGIGAWNRCLSWGGGHGSLQGSPNIRPFGKPGSYKDEQWVSHQQRRPQVSQRNPGH